MFPKVKEHWVFVSSLIKGMYFNKSYILTNELAHIKVTKILTLH